MLKIHLLQWYTAHCLVFCNCLCTISFLVLAVTMPMYNAYFGSGNSPVFTMRIDHLLVWKPFKDYFITNQVLFPDQLNRLLCLL